ncbi:endonuclease/exonuclease/phosphatase family protein [Grimontia hollisae]|uniref:Endonuclease/exonuclease/phosphatase domain-containing protein n=1 Tax=Grimontia hollisae CIP 101886 TaxID=675812 RepID=D0I6F7_GRIHO|nr:endonuclease/exonuclease/phosphatase family protein [Grimontia hollisae]EEY72226.1 hypothetical protein VHA_001324 [Grimontia hollisae CIP 101886]MDF2185953.1 endonuclease/exonuclease/phosphatase family protein [Grimontia hollisae]STO45303.1 3-phytase (myo-inositol-hexaphosphate 3-phosphohydrolase) [Grimontia hollisae]STQ76340.1 3-phytase (myo-inositol-hexaphosphate 3-phosphohydrolase) [Grimontia hollisae]
MGSDNNVLRFATFNVAMSADAPGDIFRELKAGTHRRYAHIAAIIQHIQPDVLLLCEFDHPGQGGDDGMLAYFQQAYLEKPRCGQPAIHYPFQYAPPTNTGLAVCNGEDVATLPERAHGFGRHHGQYGFVVLSRYPLDLENLRSWQTLGWASYPDSKMPRAYFAGKGLGSLRLSSKNHIALPVIVHDKVIQLVACHPTPPVFDGTEKRNYKRNADELRLLHDIVRGADFLVDDAGKAGGLTPSQPFVVMGDLNADPVNGDGDHNAIRQLLDDAKIQDVKPESDGAEAALLHAHTRRKRQATHHRGLRLDYVLPSIHFNVLDAGVFWPNPDNLLGHLIHNHKGNAVASHSSDHRLVWVDLQLR